MFLGVHLCTDEARCYFSASSSLAPKTSILLGAAVGLERRGHQVYHLVNVVPSSFMSLLNRMELLDLFSLGPLRQTEF